MVVWDFSHQQYHYEEKNSAPPLSLMKKITTWGLSLHIFSPQKAKEKHLLGCPRKLGSKVRINGLVHLLLNGVYWGEITHLHDIHWLNTATGWILFRKKPIPTHPHLISAGKKSSEVVPFLDSNLLLVLLMVQKSHSQPPGMLLKHAKTMFK